MRRLNDWYAELALGSEGQGWEVGVWRAEVHRRHTTLLIPFGGFAREISLTVEALWPNSLQGY